MYLYRKVTIAAYESLFSLVNECGSRNSAIDPVYEPTFFKFKVVGECQTLLERDFFGRPFIDVDQTFH